MLDQSHGKFNKNLPLLKTHCAVKHSRSLDEIQIEMQSYNSTTPRVRWLSERADEHVAGYDVS